MKDQTTLLEKETATSIINVLLVEDHDIVRQGIHELLKSDDGI